MTETWNARPRLQDFRFNAVIDWIEVEVTFDQPTQHRHVRTRLLKAETRPGKAPFVWVDTDHPSGSSRTIGFKMHDPQGPADLMRYVQYARPPQHRALVEADVRIVSIEIALDAYHHAEDRASLVAMCLHMFRHRSRIPDGPAVITEKRHFRAAAHVGMVQRAIDDGLTINTRGEHLPYRTRHYLKQSDSRGEEAYEQLPRAEHRARMEAILTGSARPFTTLQGWRAFRFEALAPFFAMRALRTPVSPMHATLLGATPQFGTVHDPEKVAAHRRLHRRATRADSRWDDQARNALRRLTRNQR